MWFAAVIPWIGKLGAAVASLGAAIGGVVSRGGSAARAIMPTVAKYGALTAAAGGLSKAMAQGAAKASPSSVSTQTALSPLLSDMSESGERGGELTLTDKQHKREIKLRREAMWLQSLRDVSVTALKHPTIGYVAGVLVIDAMGRTNVMSSPTATALKSVVLTDMGVRTAAVLVDALVPG